MEDLKKDLQQVLISLEDSTVICTSLYSELLNKTKPGGPDFSKRLEIISRLNQVISFFNFLRNDSEQKYPQVLS